MTTPLVSVVIPCFNAERYVGETLESVLAQTWPNIEIIVVDDGSTDGSVEAARRYEKSGVRLIEQGNAGAGAARNRAYAAAQGEFIQFLDADDLIDPEKISLQMARLQAAPRSIASAEWGRFRETPAEARFRAEDCWGDLTPLEWLTRSRKDGLGMMFPALWLIPRAVCERAGPWNEALSLGDDGEYFTRVVLASEEVLFCKGARCRYRSGLPSSLSGQKSPRHWASQFQVIDLCERYVRAREDSPRVRRGFALSWQHLAHGAHPYDAGLAESAMRRAVALDPVRIRPGGGPAFAAISWLIGWRAARKLQVLSGRP
jgi:glycosyltransferase involved in cell wall biosynthesis